jgi:hypothetical protein
MFGKFRCCAYASSHKQKYIAAHVRTACGITGADARSNRQERPARESLTDCNGKPGRDPSSSAVGALQNYEVPGLSFVVRFVINDLGLIAG